MATLYEHYNTGDDMSVSLYGNTWNAQTFTPSESHRITSVKLKLLRYGLPGTVTVSIRATTVDGRPTAGPDLCSGTTNGNTLTLWVFGEENEGNWREISFGAGYGLAAGTKYAIVVRLVGDISNNLRWRLDNTSPTYTDGNYEVSLSAGISWTAITGKDFMFEEWGETIVEATAGYIWVDGVKLHYGDESNIERTCEGADTGNNGTAGHIWVEGTYLHYTDENGDERRIEGSSGAASGQTPGHLWIEGANLHYIDSSGNERYIVGA